MSLSDFKNKRSMIKRMQYHENLGSRKYYFGRTRTILRLEWERAVMKEVLQQHKINVEDVFRKYNRGTFLKRLDRCLNEFYRRSYDVDDDSLSSRIWKKIKGEDD